jgi:hypothetical protein
MKINQLYEAKTLDEIPVCPQECLVIISNTTGLSFSLERIEPLTAIIIIIFYLLVLYLFALSNTLKNPFASIYSDSLIKTACQHLLLLVGFDTLIYWKYYDTPPILVGYQSLNLLLLLKTMWKQPSLPMFKTCYESSNWWNISLTFLPMTNYFKNLQILSFIFLTQIWTLSGRD